MARMQVLPLALCFCLVIMCKFHFIESSKSTGFSLKLIYRDSIESLFHRGNLTYLERMERLIRFSQPRGYYLKSISRLNDTIEPAENLSLPASRDSFLYYVETAIGSQSIKLFLIFDTGSGLIWTQCEPCKNCFEQQDPIYDSRASTSHRRLSCDHPLCSGNDPLYQCKNNQCVYRIRYADESSTRGVVSLENFSFHDDIVFGCSNDNRNFRFTEKGIISGILGLYKSPDSLISQLSNVNRRFSYCMAPFNQLLQQPGFLRFGDDIPPPSENVKVTRFVPNPNPKNKYFYYLDLLDISVGDVRVGFSPDQFKIRRNGSGGLLIDSGTVISKLDITKTGKHSAYDAVMELFQDYYDSRLLQRKKDVKQFGLCYKCPPDYDDFVTMTYHFEGADYRVEAEYVHYPDSLSLGYFCVAIRPANGESVLGLWHQQNMRITYDGNIDGLQFAPENCLDDQL